MTVRLAGDMVFSFQDYPDKTAGCIIVYLPGCSHGCYNCHNKEWQDWTKGKKYSYVEMVNELNSMAIKHKTNNIVFQGGDPLFVNNILFMKEFLTNNEIFYHYNVCVYTGYDIKYVKKVMKKNKAAFWKCGEFDEKTLRESGKTDKQFILSSSNQEFYDSKFRRISKNGILKFNSLKYKFRSR